MRSPSQHEANEARQLRRKHLHHYRRRIRSHSASSSSSASPCPSSTVSSPRQSYDVHPHQSRPSTPEEPEEPEATECESESLAISGQSIFYPLCIVPRLLELTDLSLPIEGLFVNVTTPRSDKATKIVPTLPLELLLDAAQILHFDEDQNFTKEERRKTGRSLALSCRALNVVGTAIGWREVSQVLGRDEFKLERLLRNDYIASSVRTLFLEVDRTKSIVGDYRNILNLLNRLTNLRQLVLGRTDLVLMQHLFRRFVPTRINLRYVEVQLVGFTSLVKPLRALCLISTLGSVKLTLHGASIEELWSKGRLAQDEMDSLATSPLASLGLRQLRVNIAAGNSEINGAFLRLLLRRFVSSDRLECLEIELDVHITNVAWFDHFRNLKQLRIAFPPTPATPTPATVTYQHHLSAISASLPHLQQLRWLFIGISKEEERQSKTLNLSPQRLQNLLNNIPPLVERVEFDIDFAGGAQSEPLLSFLDARRTMAMQRMVVKRAKMSSDQLSSRFRDELILKGTSGTGEVKWVIKASLSALYARQSD